MCDTSEEKIISTLRVLKELSPSPEHSEAAVSRVLEQVRQADVAPQPIRRRHFLLRGSIAAGLLLMVGVAWFMGRGREVSAAELLQQALDASNGYRGWVHMAFDGDVQLSSGIRREEHFNRADGTHVIVTRNKEKSWIRMEVPSRGEMAEYTSLTNQIQLGDMFPYNVKVVKKNTAGAQIDLASTLARFKEATGSEPRNISRKREGDQERIDIRYFADVTEAKKVLEPLNHWGSLPLEATLWIDPKSKLIQRASVMGVSRYQDGIRQSPPNNWCISYGPPELKDIYDAGAPHDATIDDHRTTGEKKLVWERLERRHEQGYGDGIALVTGSDLHEDGSVDSRGNNISIYMRQDSARFFGDYYISSKPGTLSGKPRISPFADWPTPTLEEVLQRARLASPELIFVTADGQRAWGGDVDANLARWLDDQDLSWWDAVMPHNISGRIWPTRRSMWIYETGASFEMSSDAAHPERLLLHARRYGTLGPCTTVNPCLYEEEFHWLDTSRDDMPVRILKRSFTDNGLKVSFEYEYEYLDWAQMANGQWYPTLWHSKNSENQNGVLTVTSRGEHRLRIFPKAAIDPAWFQPPVTSSPAP